MYLCFFDQISGKKKCLASLTNPHNGQVQALTITFLIVVVAPLPSSVDSTLQPDCSMFPYSFSLEELYPKKSNFSFNILNRD